MAQVSRHTEVYVASTHYHVEHTTGIAAFPPPARYVNSRIQQAEFAEGAAAQAKAFAARSALDAELVSDVSPRPADVPNVLFAGDVVMNNSFVAATENSSIRAWLAAFDLLDTWVPRTIVPAHGEVGSGALIGANRGVMLALAARARELKAQGRTVDEVAATVQREMQEKHPGFARINGAGGAARAAYAEAP